MKPMPMSGQATAFWRRASVTSAAFFALLAASVPSGFALGSDDRGSPTPHTVGPAPKEPSIAVPYQAEQLWRQGITGKGSTVAVLVSFGDRRIEEFMAEYDRQYNLPPADIRRVEPVGKVPSCTDSGVNTENCHAWESETRLDVAMIHTLAPEARIVIAAIPVDETQGETGMPEMMRALDHLTERRLADVVSMSFGSPEENFRDPRSIPGYGRAFDRADHAGMTLVASSGDHGPTGPLRDRPERHHRHRTVAWPASDPRVTAVGGVQLHVDADGHRTSPDTLWPKSGAGHSSHFARPAWQSPTPGTGSAYGRSIPDITMQGAAGTSQSAPLFAGVLALAVQLHHGRLGNVNPALYKLGSQGSAAGIVDVTEGDDSYGGVPGFTAEPGFDTASGWGTVDVPKFARALADARSLHE
ncbi:S53 family peptidase [Streptomyces olivoreticuli]|uniref:S53 family peptidase n=1 Tax=Streptomyces olivoreticuli TaxID=68246 RepID=UPI0026596B0B|nr:S53 family peptidase [Streptomyces olivoreticuli]WKK26612.1 S53 family peptidase [Streptomyces olivoreticuli]